MTTLAMARPDDTRAFLDVPATGGEFLIELGVALFPVVGVQALTDEGSNTVGLALTVPKPVFGDSVDYLDIEMTPDAGREMAARLAGWSFTHPNAAGSWGRVWSFPGAGELYQAAEVRVSTCFPYDGRPGAVLVVVDHHRREVLSVTLRASERGTLVEALRFAAGWAGGAR